MQPLTHARKLKSNARNPVSYCAKVQPSLNAGCMSFSTACVQSKQTGMFPLTKSS